MNRVLMAVVPCSAALAVSLPAGPAGAQFATEPLACGKRADVIRQLGEKYGETRRSLGISGAQGVVEIYASAETGSWTILVTSPQGVSCLMAAGSSFQAEPAMPVGAPA